MANDQKGDQWGGRTECRLVLAPAKVTGKKFPPAAIPLTCSGCVTSMVKWVTNLTALAQVAFSPLRILPVFAWRIQLFKICVWFVRALTILPFKVLSRFGYTLQ